MLSGPREAWQENGPGKSGGIEGKTSGRGERLLKMCDQM
jgi:hypothetical protein